MKKYGFQGLENPEREANDTALPVQVGIAPSMLSGLSSPN